MASMSIGFPHFGQFSPCPSMWLPGLNSHLTMMQHLKVVTTLGSSILSRFILRSCISLRMTETSIISIRIYQKRGKGAQPHHTLTLPPEQPQHRHHPHHKMFSRPLYTLCGSVWTCLKQSRVLCSEAKHVSWGDGSG